MGSTGCFADAIESSLVGAWGPSAPDCTKLFERRGGALAYRQPVDKFAQAAIVEPGQILLPSGACRVQSVSHEKGVVKLNAECNDSISYTPVTMQIKIQSGSEIILSPNGDPALETALVKCRL